MQPYVIVEKTNLLEHSFISEVLQVQSSNNPEYKVYTGQIGEPWTRSMHRLLRETKPKDTTMDLTSQVIAQVQFFFNINNFQRDG